jgi:hypothetical protein
MRWRLDEVECLHLQQNEVVGVSYLEIKDRILVQFTVSFRIQFPVASLVSVSIFHQLAVLDLALVLA